MSYGLSKALAVLIGAAILLAGWVVWALAMKVVKRRRRAPGR